MSMESQMDMVNIIGRTDVSTKVFSKMVSGMAKVFGRKDLVKLILMMENG